MLTGLGGGKSQSYQDPAAADRQRRVLDEGFDMRIAADGTWFYQGTPINRLPLVKLFASVLRREDDGEYWLVTPVERGRVRVEDAPFTAVEVTAEDAGPAQRLIFRTNLDEIVALDEAHPLQSRPDPHEVADVFEVPLDFLIDPANRHRHSRIYQERERFFWAIPYEDRYIWGATAGMLVNLSELLWSDP
ncbi:MAG: DUF1285 domain-containing protein [Dongiales bacterium]